MMNNPRRWLGYSTVCVSLIACVPVHDTSALEAVPPQPPYAWSDADPTREEHPTPPASPVLTVGEDAGGVAFLSSAPAGGAAEPDDSEPPEVYAFGKPPYADVELPLALDAYTSTYGLDDFEVQLDMRMRRSGPATNPRAPTCAATG